MTGLNTPNTPGNPIDNIKISNDDLRGITYLKPRGGYSVGRCEIPAGKVEIRLGRVQNGYQIRVDDDKGTLYEIEFQLSGTGVTSVIKTKYNPDQADDKGETAEWTSEEISQILAGIAREGTGKTEETQKIAKTTKERVAEATEPTA